MRPECIQAINKAAGKILADREIKRIETDIIYHVNNTPNEGLSRAERYQIAAEKALGARIKETATLIHTHIDEAYKHLAISDDIDQIQLGLQGRTQALFNKLFYKAGSSEVPLEKKIEAHNSTTHTPFAKFSELGSKNLRFSSDKTYTFEVAKSVLGEHVSNRSAKAHGELYLKTMKDLHRQAEEAGIGFKFREPQPIDPFYYFES